ncbi:MAG: hypothetical protein HZB16_05020 [Armatimonadetes bacterium]|nr:hypothetical protein [Armatimonadota bacterium]
MLLGRRRRNFHPQNDTPGCARSTLGTAVMMVVYVPALLYLARLGVPFWQMLPGIIAALAVSTTAMLWAMNGTLRTGVSTDRDGLCEHFWLRRRRRLPWAEITSVEQSDQGAVVHHPRGAVRLEPPLSDWAQLGALAQRHLSGEPPCLAGHRARRRAGRPLGLPPLGHPRRGRSVRHGHSRLPVRE